jgi:hypothetical protein
MSSDVSISPKGMFLVPSGTVYEMNTTAVYSGMIRLAVKYDDAELNRAQENALKLKCYERASGEWEDITTDVDLANNIIYGQSPHLSFFIVTVTP